MVDDSAADRKLCRLLLEETHGPRLEFFEAAAAGAGLETCRTVLPDCVLLDYRLPDMTGLEFLAHLREDSGVAVVMLSGTASDQVAVKAMKAGAQDYLDKDRITAEGLGLAIRNATQKVNLLRALQAERDHLARSLAEKEVLLQEVHHRVKNNLQVIASLLRLQADAFGDQAFAAALHESQQRVESMAMIHEQLYESADLHRVDVAKHAGLVLSNLLHAYGVDPACISGRVVQENESLMLGVDQAIPAGLILNELISNALKHGFPRDAPAQLWWRSAGGTASFCSRSATPVWVFLRASVWTGPSRWGFASSRYSLASSKELVRLNRSPDLHFACRFQALQMR